MTEQMWIYVNCGDRASKIRCLRLGRIRRGIIMAAPAADVTVWNLEQAEQLQDELGKLITELRNESATTATP